MWYMEKGVKNSAFVILIWHIEIVFSMRGIETDIPVLYVL